MNFVRETIFSSALRTFFRVLMGMAAFILGLVVIGILCMFLSKPYDIQEQVSMVILPDEEGSSTPLPESAPAILQIDITQEIGTNLLLPSQITTILHASREGALRHDRVKAILLYVDSPGGATLDSDDIYRALMAYKTKFQVPIHAYVQGLCASGAYYISCVADKISSSPVSIIGSVGVISGPQFNVFDLMERYGVKSKVITRGQNKAPFLPYTPWPEGEEAKKAEAPMLALTDYYYNRFVDIVTNNRSAISKTALINEYGASIYVAGKAKELGFIDDAEASRESALSTLAKAAGIEGKYQCISLAPVTPFFQDMFQNKAPHKHSYHRFYYLMQ